MNDYVLIHHGILGMKWGVRRYQNEDGSLTEAGQKRYNKQQEKLSTYKQKQTESNDKYYDTELLRNAKRGQKYYEKGMKALEDGNAKKYDKYDKKYIQSQREAVFLQTMRELQNKRVSELTYDKMQKENVAVGASVATNLLITFGTAGLAAAGASPFYMVSIGSSPDDVRRSTRVSNSEYWNMRSAVNNMPVKKQTVHYIS